MKVFAGVDELEGVLGTHLGFSQWHTITQEQVDAFADATGDHQWIHVDTERAAQGPFGTTIAHGYLTLSMIASLVPQVYRVDGLRMGINYGADKVRFPSPVPVGSRIRAGVTPRTLERTAQGVRLTAEVVVEREGSDKPACVVEAVTLLVP